MIQTIKSEFHPHVKMEPEEDRGGSTNEPASIAIAVIKKGNSNCSPF
jgi:hypothetical protein